jgi:hypothetical protein
MVGPSALTVLRVITILEFDEWLDRKLFGTGHNFVDVARGAALMLPVNPKSERVLASDRSRCKDC